MTKCGLFDSYGPPGSIDDQENYLRFEERKMRIDFRAKQGKNINKIKAIAMVLILLSTLVFGSTAFGITQIYTETDLRTLATEVRGGNNYAGITVYLMNDITMSSTAFDPIGFSGKGFSGTFDGQGYTISSININNSDDKGTGLFGYTNESGVVKNVRLTGTIVGGSDTTGGSSMYAGSIVGYHKGLIENCINECSVTGRRPGMPASGLVNTYNVGGIVGCLDGGTIRNTINKGTVYTYRQCGGIAGLVHTTAGALIENCVNTGYVHTSGADVGGIVGYGSYCTVKNCYNTGKVQGYVSNSWVGTYGIGGLVGNMRTANFRIENCYNVGQVNNTDTGSPKGGFGWICGRRNNGTITNTYYYYSNLSSMTGVRSAGSGSGTGTSKTQAEMQNAAMVTTLNASQNPAPWVQDITNSNNGYPILIYQLKVDESTCLIMTWEIPANTTIKLPIPTRNSNSFVVDWGDGKVTGHTTDDFPSHTYTTAGTYTIKISGSVWVFGHIQEEQPTASNTYSDYYTYSLYLRTISKMGNLGYGYFGCSGCTGLTSFVAYNTGCTDSLVRSSFMFNNCSSLSTINMSTFSTSNVETMRYMFRNCSSLTSLDISPLDTSSTIDMCAMFMGCSGLTTLDVSTMRTSSVVNMASLFKDCSSLTYLDLSNMNNSSITNMPFMFMDDSSLEVILLGNNFSILNGENMFSGLANPCAIITERDAVFTSCGTSLGVGSNTKLYVYGKTLETTFEGNSNISTAFGGASKIQPILELIPENPMHVAKNATFTDPGYTVAGIAGTNTTHPIFTVFGYQVESTNNVNTSTPGTYTVNYGLSRVTS
jgi:surface protein